MSAENITISRVTLDLSEIFFAMKSRWFVQAVMNNPHDESPARLDTLFHWSGLVI